MSDQIASWQIAVASTNPAKINAVRDAFALAFPDVPCHVSGYKTASGVAAQPMSAAETRLGADNRLRHLQHQLQQQPADFYVAIEAGLDDGMTFAWMRITDGKREGSARSASLQLPAAVVQQLDNGDELGDVMDTLFGTQNIKQAGGAIGLLTQHKLSRSSVYQQALVLALIPFLSPDWY
ncbi:MAG: inosine/xanthosine triphosphatase [Rheinheimera sp.]|nr:inosine/xanthosine triphosphatase [Rheinheimera sp.]